MIIAAFLYHYLYDSKFIYQLLATLVTYYIIRITIFLRTRHKRYQLFDYYGIPGPKPNLLDGNLLTYRKGNQFEVEAKMAKIYGYKGYYGVFFGDEPSLIITDLKLLKRVFFDENKSFTERTEMFIDIPVSHGIIFAKYKRWKAMRKILAPSFSKYSVRGGIPTQFIEDSLKMMVDYIDFKIEKNSVDIDFHDLMKSTALHLISTMAIKLPNVQVKEKEENVKGLDAYLYSMDKGLVILAVIFPCVRDILSFLANRFEYGTVMALINKGLNKTIDAGLSKLMNLTNSKMNNNQTGHHHIDTGDGLSFSHNNNHQPTHNIDPQKNGYIPTIDSNNNNSINNSGDQIIDIMIRLLYEGKLSRKEVIGNAETLLFGGYDTTSTTMTYIFWALSKHTDIQERLREELKAHGTKSRYLKQVIDETMRLYPTVISFTTRLATKTVRLDEHSVIPEGTRVVYNAWLIYRNEKLWPNPSEFNPDRFDDGIEIHPCAFAPFGLGERRCLGYQLAILEMKMIVCDILLRYRLKLKSPQTLELISCALTLTKPKEKVVIEFERL